MNTEMDRRRAALAGLALAAAVALWWLGSTRLALDKASSTSRCAADALQALWLARAVALALLSLRAGTVRGWRSGAVESLGLITPAWPVVVLAWSASTAPWTQVALAELLLLVGGFALPLVGKGVHRVLRRAGTAEAMATATGVALAVGLWIMRDLGPLAMP